MPRISRRSFLKAAGVAAAGTAWLRPRSWAQVAGANSDVRLGIVGFHNRGTDIITKELVNLPGQRITALCDVDSAVLGAMAKRLSDQGTPVQTFADYRDLLAKGDVDAVFIVTPNHQHALQAIWACQADKDVYLEKPVCHEIWEGARVVEAAAKYRRIVQVGSQCRSSDGLAEAIAWVRAGHLGKILSARGLCYKRRDSIGLTAGPQPVPATVNYDLWLGPAPLAPLRRTRLHYDWHWQWPYGNGDLGNQGVHQMDISRWFLGEPALAPRVLTVGGRLGYVDDGRTPNSLVVVHDYAAAPLIFEVRGLPAQTGARAMDTYDGASIGVIVQCEGGRVVVPSYTTAIAYDPKGNVLKQFSGASSHEGNFIAAVRSRQTTDLHAPITEGFISTSLCHTANISYRLGQTQPPDAIREQIKANAALSEAYARLAQNLAANGVDLDKTPATLGAPLELDPATMRFRHNDAANALLRRDYRTPFVVPENV
jgi:predicted dehydrogenase